MKYIFLTCMWLFIFTSVFAQNTKQFAISFVAGKYNTPYYDAAKSRFLVGIEADYGLADRHLLNIGFISGKFDYAGNKYSSEDYFYLHKGKQINRKVDNYIFKFMYKYKLFDKVKFAIMPGIGAAILVDAEEYPFTWQRSGGASSTTIVSSTNSDLVFPVSTDFVYKISKKVQTGIVGGFLIHPDYPIIGLQAGIKFSVLLN